MTPQHLPITSSCVPTMDSTHSSAEKPGSGEGDENKNNDEEEPSDGEPGAGRSMNLQVGAPSRGDQARLLHCLWHTYTAIFRMRFPRMPPTQALMVQASPAQAANTQAQAAAQTAQPSQQDAAQLGPNSDFEVALCLPAP